MTATHITGGGARAGDRRAASTPPSSRPTWAEVDLDAVRGNVAALLAQASAPALMAVVKADGYGHGMVPVARAALAGGASWLAVALVEEGEALRAAGIDAPVLLLTEPPVEAVPAVLAAGLAPAVYSAPYAAAVDAAGRARGAPVGVHLKLDTGMRRVGVPEADWEGALRQVRDAAGLRLDALWSHHAVADEPGNPFTAVQSAAFCRGLDLARRMGVAAPLAHLTNSAGTLSLHDDHHDLVRAGLAVYGLSPAPGLADGVGLRPALAWYSRLSLVKRVAAGEAVGYGLRWTAARDTTVGTVPVGYADGVTRALAGRGRVLVRGCAAPLAGTVSMDQVTVDLGDLPAESGDEVVLLGRQGDAEVTADDWAALLGTISYEVVCGIGRRVPRVWVGSGT